MSDEDNDESWLGTTWEEQDGDLQENETHTDLRRVEERRK